MTRILATGLLCGALGAQTLTVQVNGVQNAKGTVRAALYRGKEGYPTKPEKAAAKTMEPAAAGTVTVVFNGVGPGEYAVAVYHDQNGNGKLDANFMGIPKEPTSASNDAKARMGPPSYEDARFTVSGDATIRVQLSK